MVSKDIGMLEASVAQICILNSGSRTGTLPSTNKFALGIPQGSEQYFGTKLNNCLKTEAMT
jgi:hypothetical protein